MADVYWLSFRIHDDTGYADAYESLMDALKDVADQTSWWFETTSFYLFKSENTAAQIATHIKAAIRTDRDLVVFGKTEYKTGRVIGKCDDQDIFKLVPFMKKA